MHLAIRENTPSTKISPISRSRPIKKPLTGPEEDPQNDEYMETERDDTFNMTVTDRKMLPTEQEQRTIKRSMVNRSCINNLAYCYKGLKTVPLEIT